MWDIPHSLYRDSLFLNKIVTRKCSVHSQLILTYCVTHFSSIFFPFLRTEKNLSFCNGAFKFSHKEEDMHEKGVSSE